MSRIKNILRKTMDKAPEIGAGMGATAGLVGGLALDLYRSDCANCVPRGTMTVLGAGLGGILGLGVGSAIKEIPETYRLLVAGHPEAAKSGLKRAALAAGLGGALTYLVTGDPVLTPAVSLYCGTLGGFQGYISRVIKDYSPKSKIGETK